MIASLEVSVTSQSVASGSEGSGSVSIFGLLNRALRWIRSRKPADLNRLAASIVGEATSEEPPADDGKDPAAVALGRKGGKKGGKARAKNMSAEQRSEAAKKAAQARWKR